MHADVFDCHCKNGGMKNRITDFTPLLIVAAIAPGVADARTATAAERAACEARIQPKLDAIDAKMRAGYTASEGERLKERRRKLEAERAKCKLAR